MKIVYRLFKLEKGNELFWFQAETKKELMDIASLFLCRGEYLIKELVIIE